MNRRRKPSFRQGTVAAVKKLSRTIIAILAATPWACTALAMGQAAQSQVPVMHVEVDLQPIEVQVVDANGNNILGLNEKDFTVFENGQRQRIKFFDAGNSPVSVAILVDSSNSMNSNGPLGSAQAIAAQFMRTARPGDDIYAMDFTGQTGPFQQLTREQLLNPSAVTLAPAPSGGSALYDAIAAALCHLRTSKNPRQAVIVISDGVDQYSHISLEQLIALVRSSHAQLFMIGLQSRPEFGFQGRTEPKLTLITGHDIDNPIVVFDDLMKESGAESFISNSENDLAKALRAVSNMLQSEYTLAYYPQEISTKKPRKIQVRVDRRGTRVLARRFVDSPQDAAESVHFEPGTCTVSAKFHPYPYEANITHGPSGVIYRDDFSNPRSGWPNRKDSHYLRGAYELSNPGNESVHSTAAAPGVGSGLIMMPSTSPAEVPSLTAFRQNVIAAYGPSWSDFRASVTMNVDLRRVSRKVAAQFVQNDRPAAGLLFRMGLNGYYALLVNLENGKNTIYVELVKREFEGFYRPDSYTQTQLVPWTELPIPSSNSETQLSVEAVGKQISIFVNGQKVSIVRDDAFDQGWVGFVISGPGHATFRNLLVERAGNIGK